MTIYLKFTLSCICDICHDHYRFKYNNKHNFFLLPYEIQSNSNMFTYVYHCHCHFFSSKNIKNHIKPCY